MFAYLRDRLGLSGITRRLIHLEDHMATITDALRALAEQTAGVSAAQATSFHNLQVAIERLRTGELNAEQQAQVDQIVSALETIRTDAAAADDAVEPAEEAGDDEIGPVVDEGVADTRPTDR